MQHDLLGLVHGRALFPQRDSPHHGRVIATITSAHFNEDMIIFLYLASLPGGVTDHGTWSGRHIR